MTMEPLPPTLLRDQMPEWWRPLALDLDGEIVRRRRRGVEALRLALSTRNVVDAVAYAHGDETAGHRIIGLISHAGRSADSGYTSRVGDLEPPALVAAALADQLAVAPDADLSTLVSLLILSSAHAHATPAIATMPLAEYAQRQLGHRSASLSQPPAPTQQSASALIRELLGGEEHAAGQNGASAAGQNGASAAAPNGASTPGHNGPSAPADNGAPAPALTGAALVALARRIDELAGSAGRERDELRAQLRRQAWVADPWCETAGAPWTEIDPAARALVAAVELADRTLGITPAGDAPALLRRLLGEPMRGFGPDEEAAIAAAAPLLGARFTRAPHPLLFPLATGLRAWRERGEEDAGTPDLWRPVGAWGEEQPTEELEVALQGYREALALRALGHD